MKIDLLATSKRYYHPNSSATVTYEYMSMLQENLNIHERFLCKNVLKHPLSQMLTYFSYSITWYLSLVLKLSVPIFSDNN